MVFLLNQGGASSMNLLNSLPGVLLCRCFNYYWAAASGCSKLVNLNEWYLQYQKEKLRKKIYKVLQNSLIMEMPLLLNIFLSGLTFLSRSYYRLLFPTLYARHMLFWTENSWILILIIELVSCLTLARGHLVSLIPSSRSHIECCKGLIINGICRDRA